MLAFNVFVMYMIKGIRGRLVRLCGLAISTDQIVYLSRRWLLSLETRFFDLAREITYDIRTLRVASSLVLFPK